MNCETLLKRSFIAIVGVGVTLAVVGLGLCVGYRDSCDKELAMAQDRIKDWALVVVTAVASFTAGSRGEL